MAPPIRAPGGAYEGAGRQASVAVRGYSSVVVTSDDVPAAAHTAIGIALSESAHRLVMIADLAGEAAPLQALVKDDDPHGIYDSFEFGTSFTKIARLHPSASAVRNTPASVRFSGMRPPLVGFSQYPNGGMPVMIGMQPSRK